MGTRPLGRAAAAASSVHGSQDVLAMRVQSRSHGRLCRSHMLLHRPRQTHPAHQFLGREKPVCGGAVFLEPALNADSSLSAPPVEDSAGCSAAALLPLSLAAFTHPPSCPTTRLESEESLSLREDQGLSEACGTPKEEEAACQPRSQPSQGMRTRKHSE